MADPSVFEDELFGDVPEISETKPQTPTKEYTEEYDKEEYEYQAEEQHGRSMTNLEFLSRMLHSDLRGYLKSNYKWLRSRFSDKLLDLFIDISTKMGDENVSPEVLNAMLPDLGVSDLRQSIIVDNYKLITQDDARCLCQTTYEKFREIVYRAFFDSINNGNAVDTLEAIQNSEFFLPSFGAINSDTFKQIKFGDFDMESIMEDLGSPLYSSFDPINEISPIKGYIPSQVTMVSGPPACFVGGTKIRQPDGSLKTLYQLWEEKGPIKVKFLTSEGHTEWTWRNEGVQRTGFGTDFIKITVTTSKSPIVCTPEHRFLIIDAKPNPDGEIPVIFAQWVEAKNLESGMIIRSNPMKNYVRVVKTEKMTYKKPIAFFDVVENENHNYYINAGSEEICVHNSGKSIFLMNEAVSALKQGKKVIYTALGDLRPFDFASRICSMLMKMPMSRTAMNLQSTYETACKVYPFLKENLTVQFISPDKYTPGEWFKMLEQLNLIKDNDVFIIDYDTNFATERDSMYAKGDEVYTMAFTLSQRGKYVFIGSQPKIGNWRDSELGLETASESSRKQQIIDVMITISQDRETKNPRNHMGTINVPKNRRGGTTKFKYFLDPTGNMVPITDESYMIIKDEIQPVSVIKSSASDGATKLVSNALKSEQTEE